MTGALLLSAGTLQPRYSDNALRASEFDQLLLNTAPRGFSSCVSRRSTMFLEYRSRAWCWKSCRRRRIRDFARTTDRQVSDLLIGVVQ